MKDNTIKFLTIFAVLALIIGLSGCIGIGSSSNRGPVLFPGVVITDFYADFDTIDSGEIMSLAVDFENRGDVAAKDVTGELIRKGSFEVDCLYPIPCGATAVSDLEPPIGDVFSGDEFLWDITAPVVTQDRIEELQARIYYDYTTQGFATIHFVPQDVLREKGAAAFPIDSSTNEGPLSIDIVANQPITIRGADASVKLTVTINNEWNGRVESDSVPPGGSCTSPLDCIDLLTLEGFGDACTVSSTTGLGALSESDPGVKMVQGEQAKKTYVVNFLIADQNAETSCQVRAKATYRYRVDSDVLSITVKKAFEPELNPLSLTIIDPTTANPAQWMYGSTTQYSVEVLATYDGVPITSGLETESYWHGWIGNTPLDTGVPVDSIHLGNGEWNLIFHVPSLSAGFYDLTTQLTYSGYTSSDVQANAVQYILA